MSGKKSDDSYDLTWTKANYWHKSLDKDMYYFAKLLKKKGLKVNYVKEAFLNVQAKESDIYNALQ